VWGAAKARLSLSDAAAPRTFAARST